MSQQIFPQLVPPVQPGFVHVHWRRHPGKYYMNLILLFIHYFKIVNLKSNNNDKKFIS